MTFSIRAIDVGNAHQGKCETIIGSHREIVPLITTLWTREVYESQWIEALSNLIADRVNCCILITDVQPLKSSSGITYWALYKEGGDLYVQEQFSRDRSKLLNGSTSDVASYIQPRIQGTQEEQNEVSEWVLPIEDIRHFLESSKRSHLTQCHLRDL